MSRIIAALNMTLDGFCDHTASGPDEELLRHYNELFSSADAIIYGRITYQLMESYWPTLVAHPTGIASEDAFAVLIQHIPKIVFSRTLEEVTWEGARLAKGNLQEEIPALKQQAGRDILVGSRSLIVALLNLHLIDELQLTIHPVLAGSGLSLFGDISNGTLLQLRKTKTFAQSGFATLYYAPAKA